MSQEIIVKLRRKAEETNLSLVNLIDEVEKKLSNPKDSIPLGDFSELKALMLYKRKILKITLEDLELHSGLASRGAQTVLRDRTDTAGAHLDAHPLTLLFVPDPLAEHIRLLPMLRLAVRVGNSVPSHRGLARELALSHEKTPDLYLEIFFSLRAGMFSSRGKPPSQSSPPK